MSNAICFDRVAKAKSILKAGIGSTDVNARSDLRTAAWYLLNCTSYTTRQIEARLRKISADYFAGMTESYIDSSIQEIISSVKACRESERTTDAPDSVVIYREELERIEALGHDDTERLAFAFLCVSKMMPYEQIYECNSELYRLAWRYKYDHAAKRVLQRQERRRVGGSRPTDRVNRLCRSGIVWFSTHVNTAYRQQHNGSPASTTFTVPIKRDNGEVAFVINKPEEDSIVLYYDRYKGYGGIVTCERCGRPALRTGRRQKYCAACAEEISHHPEKRDL